MSSITDIDMSNVVDIELPPRPTRSRRYSDYSDLGSFFDNHGANDRHKPVISPHVVEHRSTKYTCDAKGLKTRGFRFDASLPDLIPHIFKDDSDRLSIYQPVFNERPPNYWRAQAAFRGFNPGAPLWDLLELFRIYPNAPMEKELRELEEELIEQYKALDALERDRLWQLKSTEEKANDDPKKFLVETFSNSCRTYVLVLKVKRRYMLHFEAGRLKLNHTSTDAPLLPDGSKPEVPRWLIIGRSYKAVDDKKNEIRRDRLRIKQELEEAKRLKEEREKEEAKKREQERLAKVVVAHKELWSGCYIDRGAPPLDIMGRWVITAPRLDNVNGGPGKTCTLFIIHCKDADGSSYMWADFDFLTLKGMFKFENPETILGLIEGNYESAEGFVTNADDGIVFDFERRDDDQDMDYEDETEEGSDDEEDEGPQDDFDGDDQDEASELEDTQDDGSCSDCREDKDLLYIGNDVKPSVTLPTWDFRWRGLSKEGQYQYGSEATLCTLRFKPGSSGCTLEYFTVIF